MVVACVVIVTSVRVVVVTFVLTMIMPLVFSMRAVIVICDRRGVVASSGHDHQQCEIRNESN
jgi:hypothetical protein